VWVACAVLGVAGCNRPTTRTLPVAVYGDVRVQTGVRTVPVFEDRRAESPLRFTTGRLVVLPLRDRPGEDGRGAEIAAALRERIATHPDEMAARLGEAACAGRQPCVGVLDEAATRTLIPEAEITAGQPSPETARALRDAHGIDYVLGGEVVQADERGFAVLLEARDPSGVLWSRRVEGSDLAALVDAAVGALTPPIVPVQTGERQEPVYEMRQMVVGTRNEQVEVSESRIGFVLGFEPSWRIVPEQYNPALGLLIGLRFDDGNLSHVFLFSPGLTLPSGDCRWGDEGGGLRLIYSPQFQLDRFFVGPEMALLGFFGERRECPESGVGESSIESFDYMSAGVTGGLVFDRLRLGAVARIGWGNIQRWDGVTFGGGEEDGAIVDLGGRLVYFF